MIQVLEIPLPGVISDIPDPLPAETGPELKPTQTIFLTLA